MNFPNKNHLLITGTKSGLGRYLHEIFGGSVYTRKTQKREFNNFKKDSFDIIIHAAFNSAKDVNSNNLHSYIEDNIFLIKKILEIPHKKFILISTVDVYPKNSNRHNENEAIDINSVNRIYGITKLISESLVRKISPNFLILRCSTLLGKYSRKNSLISIFQEKKPLLNLSSKSSFNYILHSDVANFIKLAIDRDLQGIYNLASSENITLSKVALLFKKRVCFGNYTYKVGNIDNKKVVSILPLFQRTSIETINIFTSVP